MYFLIRKYTASSYTAGTSKDSTPAKLHASSLCVSVTICSFRQVALAVQSNSGNREMVEVGNTVQMSSFQRHDKYMTQLRLI